MNSYLAHLLKKTSAATSVVEADPHHEHLLPYHHLKVLQNQVLWLAAHCMFPVQLLSPVKYLGMNMNMSHLTNGQHISAFIFCCNVMIMPSPLAV